MFEISNPDFGPGRPRPVPAQAGCRDPVGNKSSPDRDVTSHG